jgi:hypothetical protein
LLAAGRAAGLGRPGRVAGVGLLPGLPPLPAPPPPGPPLPVAELRAGLRWLFRLLLLLPSAAVETLLWPLAVATRPSPAAACAPLAKLSRWRPPLLRPPACPAGLLSGERLGVKPPPAPPCVRGGGGGLSAAPGAMLLLLLQLLPLGGEKRATPVGA